MSTKLTPMMEQYLRIKDDYPDALLFFRMGDFYELFFQDAELAARELQIALTSRNPNDDNKVPMCGVPYHALEEYLRQLLEKRFKIAICDQIEDPRQAKGLVKRAVTRVLTPGTVVEDTSLQAKTNNYLCALTSSSSRNEGGLAWIDFSTGHWSGLVSKHEQELWQWMDKLNPSEILCPEGMTVPAPFIHLKERISWLPFSAYFDLSRATESLCSVQGVTNLEPLDLEDKPGLAQACGALLIYLRQTQKQDLSHIKSFSPLNLSKHLILDDVTERNLEIFQRLDGGKGPGTLWHVLDFTKTPMGGRLLQARLRHPWRELKPIQANQETVAFFFAKDNLRKAIQTALETVYDLERLSTRIALNRCSPKDFMALRTSLDHLPELERKLGEAAKEEESPKEILKVLKAWDNLEDLQALLQKSLVGNPPTIITEGGLFQSGYDDELDELLELTEHGEGKLKDLLHSEQTGHDLPKLKLGFNRVFGYYFELSKAHKGPVPEHFHRRQTLVNSERYVTDELKDLEEKLFSASERRKNLEYELFQRLREEVHGLQGRIIAMADILGRIDVWQGLAQAASSREWNRPEVHTGLDIHIQQGRHPAVEASLGRADYIPNDLSLTSQGNILLITGPNMAGKSTVLRQAAIICILAQIGSFVPARSCSLGLADRIFTRVGASDNLSQGRSTFMVEMTETARILRQAGKRSLIILDEIGRGTSTYDGMALAWAVIENLAHKGEQGVRTLFATHFHELTELESSIPGIRNFNIAVKEWKGDVIFLRRMVPGPADRSYGIEVAKLAGVPKPVIQRARELLSDLERKSDNLHKKNSSRAPSQSLLPGLFQNRQEAEAATSKAQEPHPLVQKLQDLELEKMTPLEAMNLLQEWKNTWSDQ